MSIRLTLLFRAMVMTATVAGVYGLPSIVVPAQAQVTATQVKTEPLLHSLFTDHMVLQRDRKISVWGWTTPGTQVEISVVTQKVTAKADQDGKWTAQIGPFPAGGPYTLTANTKPAGGAAPQTAQVQDVLFGDVWLCSGQSNMQWKVGWTLDNKDAEIAAANHPNIRFFTVPNIAKLTPQQTLGGNWRPVSPQTVREITAVGYFFGRELNRELNVPIGLIDASWGGTLAEAWVSEGSLRQMPDFTKQLDAVKMDAEGRGESFEQKMQKWFQANDPGTSATPPWFAPEVTATEWKATTLPGMLENKISPKFDGVAWFRREVTVPEAWAGKDLTISLGEIDDRDTTYWNGVKVGGIDTWKQARNYKIPGEAVKAGKNVITLRVLDVAGGGGFTSFPADLKLSLDANNFLPLNGDWTYRVGVELGKVPAPPMTVEGTPNVTTVLYNGMIQPLIPYGIKGTIWYQGESNAWRAPQYQTLLPTLITDWRTQWKQGDFPFYIVQLANYMAPDKQPANDPWVQLREAQNIAASKVPNTGVAVIIDIGSETDIHPTNKQDVGKRLALIALARDYGKKIEYSGPVYKSMKVEGNSIRLEFDRAEGLMAKGGKPTAFAIAGADKKFVWADALIEDQTIVVSSPNVAEPVAVRYAWSNNPAANVYNAAGLPASPFRTDKW